MKHPVQPLGFLWFATWLCASGCTPPLESSHCIPPIDAPDGTIRFSRIAVGVENDKLRVRGFGEAAPPGTRIWFDTSDNTIADEKGRFDFEGPKPLSNTVVLYFSVPSVDGNQEFQQTFRVINDSNCTVKRAFATGTTPNDVVLAPCAQEVIALVPTSGDARVQRIALPPAPTSPRESPYFPLIENQAPLPFSVAFQNETGLGATSLNGQAGVALFDGCSGEVLDIETQAQSSSPFYLDVSPPVQVSTAIDADGDGSSETTIDRMLPRTPQGVVFANGQLWLAFTNLLQSALRPGDAAIFGPGLVITYDVIDNQIQRAGSIVLPYLNPQSLAVDDAGRVWVSCSGSFGYDASGQFTSTSPGGLVRLSTSGTEIEHQINFNSFAPGTPVFTPERGAVGSLLSGSVAFFSMEIESVDQADVVPLGGTGIESVFDIAPLGGGLALATEFSTDAVHIIDLDTAQVDPWPFSQPFSLRSSGTATRGASAIARSPSTDRLFFAVVLSLSAELVPLDLRWRIGP